MRYLGSELDDPRSSPPIIYKLWVAGAKEQASAQRLIPEYKSYVVVENDTVSQTQASSQAAFTSILPLICRVYGRTRDLRRLWESTRHQCRVVVVAVYLLAIIICGRFFCRQGGNFTTDVVIG